MKGGFSCIIVGNKNSVKLYIQLPSEYKSYFENIFYSTFVASEGILLQDTQITQALDKPSHYLVF
jgi:hypothetical protein